MKRLALFFFLTSCASQPDLRPYLFSRGKQKHNVTVYAADGSENFRGLSFGNIGEDKAQVIMLSPVGFTLLKADITHTDEMTLSYISPSLKEYQARLEYLLKKLGKLFWLKQGDLVKDLKLVAFFDDGTVKELEWQLASLRIHVGIEKL